MREKEEERQNIDNVGCGNSEVESFALGDDKVSSLRHHGNELNQLHHGQVRFPPDREGNSSLLILGVHADEVVCVHNSVDETIEENCQINVTVVENVCVEPVEQKDGGVVVNVKEGKLIPLLSQNNKDGVPEVPDFGNVEQP